MDHPSGNDIAGYKQFLDNFCEEIEDLTIQDDNLPIKIFYYYLREEEIEGECLEWSQQYLLAQNCPKQLAVHIARSVYVEICKCDITQYQVDDDDEDSKDNSDEENTEKVSLRDITFLDVRKLLKEILHTVHKVCQQWKTQLPPLRTNQPFNEVCAHAIKNIRRKMEDVHVICPDLNSLFNLKDCASHSYYSVFDGHGGIEAALYAASHLHVNLVHHPKFLTDPVTAFKDAYKQTDEGFLIKANKQKLKSGTTGVSVLIQGSKLYMAWLGDSQAVLVRNGQTVGTMIPHKPDNVSERERIEKLGGIVIWFGTWRVNGAIAVARAIGDRVHKPFICSDAEVITADLDGTEDYILLACDGVWDVLSPKDIPELVYKHIQENPENRSQTAHRIVDIAKENGSNDNISVVVVFLRDDISVPQGNMHIKFPHLAANETNDRDEDHSSGSQSNPNNSDDSQKQADTKNTTETITQIDPVSNKQTSNLKEDSSQS